jgi:hypothetical protein
MRTVVLLGTFLLSIQPASYSQAKQTHGPDCSGGWPTNMTFTHLKNAGLVDNDGIDFSKTTTVRLASEQIGRDLWHQIYQVEFTKKSGDTVSAIAIHDASKEECSMTGVEVFLISKHLSEK